MTAAAPSEAVLALLERLQGNDDERRIGLRIIVDEVEADDGGYVLDRVLVLQYRFRLPDHLGGPRDRCASGQLHDDEECALIVLGQESRGRDACQPVGAHRRDHDHHDADDRKAHDACDRGSVGIAHTVDRVHDLADQAAARPVMGLEKHPAQRRRQRQRIDGGNEHRHRDGDRELAEQFAGDAGDECDRHEHREQDQRDRDDGCGDLLHRQLGRFAGREFRMFLHHAFDVLDHHDGVVDHDADGEHHGEQRDRIGGIADRHRAR